MQINELIQRLESIRNEVGNISIDVLRYNEEFNIEEVRIDYAHWELLWASIRIS